MQRPNSILVSAALGILWACSGRDSTGPKAGPVASVELSPATATLSSLGATQSLSVVVKDSRGNSLSGKTVVWTSSAPGVAKVDAAGVVTAVINGSAIITAAVDGITGQATVTVEQQVAQLRTRRLSLGSQGNTRAGEPFDVSVEALDAGGNRVTTFAAPVTLALGANPEIGRAHV